jgi:hypothetical protein
MMPLSFIAFDEMTFEEDSKAPVLVLLSELEALGGQALVEQHSGLQLLLLQSEETQQLCLRGPRDYHPMNEHSLFDAASRFD